MFIGVIYYFNNFHNWWKRGFLDYGKLRQFSTVLLEFSKLCGKEKNIEKHRSFYFSLQ